MQKLKSQRLLAIRQLKPDIGYCRELAKNNVTQSRQILEQSRRCPILSRTDKHRLVSQTLHFWRDGDSFSKRRIEKFRQRFMRRNTVGSDLKGTIELAAWRSDNREIGNVPPPRHQRQREFPFRNTKLRFPCHDYIINRYCRYSIWQYNTISCALVTLPSAGFTLTPFKGK